MRLTEDDTVLMRKPKNRQIYCDLPPGDFEFLVKQFKTIAPERRKGVSKAKIAQILFRTIIIALKRPNHYSMWEILSRMCMAPIRPKDEEGLNQITELLTK